MSEKFPYLPTKFLYNSYRKEMTMWYRKKLSNSLHKTVVSWEHYIYVDSNFNNQNVDTSETFYHLTTNKPMYKYYCSTKDAWNLRESRLFETAEADLSAETRFIVDNFTDVDFPSDVNPRIWFVDIETSRTIDNSFPSFKNNSAEITAITIYDSYTKVYFNLGLLPKEWNKSIAETENSIKEATKDYGTVVTYTFVTPEDLLRKFMDLMNKYIPDIVTCYNAPFDIPYIVRKIYDYFGEGGLKGISPFRRVSNKVLQAIQTNDELNLITLIPGIDCLDLLELYKKYESSQKESYKLNDIANLELGESKIGYDDNGEGKDLFDTYENEYIDFMKYNIQDVRLIVLLEEKCKVLKLACAIRNYTKVDYSSTIGTVAPIDSLFLMEAVRRRTDGDMRVLPSKSKNAKQKFTGAYVKPPIVGRHRWLADEDFRSLYPSITKTFKISSESLVGTIFDNQVITLINIARFYKDTNKDIEYIKEELFPIYLYSDHNVLQYIGNEAYGQPLSELGKDYKIKIKKYETLYKEKNYPMEFKSIDEFNKWLLDNNFAILPNGAIFDQNKEDAIISKVIADVMNKRDEYKNIMKQLLKESNEAKINGNEQLAEDKKEESIVFDMNQRAVKVINNGCFIGKTLITMSDGSQKRIDEIVVGDEVKSYNIKTQKIETKKVLWSGKTKDTNDLVRLYPIINKDFVLYSVKDKEIICTPEHKIYTTNRGYIEAKDITDTDKILSEEFTFQGLKTEKVNLLNSVPVYDLTIEDNHNFFANDILVHNCYGATSSESFRLFNLDVAEGITTSGQVIIRNSRNIANKKLNELCGTDEEDYIITIDTDSLIFTMDKLVKYDVTERRVDKLEEIAEIPCIIQSEVNDKIANIVRDVFHKNNVNKDNNFLYIKNEWLADSGLFLAKKRYVIHQIFKEGIPFEQLSATGVDIKRSTTPKMFKKFYEEVLLDILSFTDKKEIDELIIQETDKLKNEYSLQDIAIPCGIRDMNKYTDNLPVHVRGAKIWNDFYAKDELDKITNGKIKYVYVKKWDIPELNQMLHYCSKPVGSNMSDPGFEKNYRYDERGYWVNITKPEYVISIPNDKEKWDMIQNRVEIDWVKMKDRLIVQPILRFYEALEWNMPLKATVDNNCIFSQFLK